MRPNSPAPAPERGFTYETSGDKFQQVTGNFDGAGLSFGPAQVNFKTGTLAPLFAEFRAADEATLAARFGGGDDWQEWLRVLALGSWQDQVAWADGISTGRSKAEVIEPWLGYLQAVGRVRRFRAIMVEEILRKYGRIVLADVRFLKQLRPDIVIDHLRCLCSLYDTAIQQGGLQKAQAEITRQSAQENPTEQFRLVRLAVEARGRLADPQWVADCISRRAGILTGVPQTITAWGQTTQRANINFFMLRDVRVTGAAEIVAQPEGAANQELAAVSAALASGSTLLR